MARECCFGRELTLFIDMLLMLMLFIIYSHESINKVGSPIPRAHLSMLVQLKEQEEAISPSHGDSKIYPVIILIFTVKSRSISAFSSLLTVLVFFVCRSMVMAKALIR